MGISCLVCSPFPSMKGVKKKIFAVLKKEQSHVCIGSEAPPKIFPLCIRACSSVDENNGESFVVPKGCFSVYVGKEKRKFFLPISYLSHPVMRALLERSAEEFGVSQAGIITIPCDVISFQHALWLVHSDHTGEDKNTEEMAEHYYHQEKEVAHS